MIIHLQINETTAFSAIFSSEDFFKEQSKDMTISFHFILRNPNDFQNTRSRCDTKHDNNKNDQSQQIIIQLQLLIGLHFASLLFELPKWCHVCTP